jgi:hypothetical protein
LGLKQHPSGRHLNADVGTECEVHDLLLRFSADFLQDYGYSHHRMEQLSGQGDLLKNGTNMCLDSHVHDAVSFALTMR